jgi:hypothetical protein
VRLEWARGREGSEGVTSLSRLPALANGGGALYRGPGGGDGVFSAGAGGAATTSGRPPRLGGGGAGGAPRLAEAVLAVLGGPAGGGGGGALDLNASRCSCIFFSANHDSTKSWFASSWSSVTPSWTSSPFSFGSKESRTELRLFGGDDGVTVNGDDMTGEGWCGSCTAFELLWPKRPPNRLLCCLSGLGYWWPLPMPPESAKGLDRVFLCAFFSRSSIFFLNVFASFSSENEKPARQSSSSKVWKKVRSWLYTNVSKISWSQMTPRLDG